ncbi:MAG: alpha-amylase family protein [Bacteroidetes bacterium]|nr:alpha-amylase family protein [Bacteroidota bacterium]
MRFSSKFFLFLLLLSSLGFKDDPVIQKVPFKIGSSEKKIVIYQVFTRLFGNTNTTNKPWGTIEENGVGKFRDFTPKALREIKELGVTHIWFTGVLHHAVIRDYTAYGISNDDPDVVKGRAGSPYAVKDYYSVDPDLAVDPSKRMEEFHALVQRTHEQGLKVIIDIVPNHVARKYHSIGKPAGVKDFGENDDKTVVYARNNNFYYLPGESFKVPALPDNQKPLGGDPNPLSDGKFDENPAKWTGNGSRLAQPRADDWYETVKINYGIKPDGTKDFELLPAGYDTKPILDHCAFWQGKSVPDSWVKFRNICLFWLKFGVDGFRFDMAEMVPVEFWSYLNSTIKKEYPKTTLVAEVYNPQRYRSYLHTGKMDFLYDKVAFYDTLKKVIQGKTSPDRLIKVQSDVADIEHHMLHFLENHDEQRLASPAFAGNAAMGKPAMVVSATISTSPTLIYFGQEVGEPGAEHAGYGQPTRTSIFDYIGVPAHQRWMNGGAFDGGSLTNEEKSLRNFYKRLLNFTITSPALMGQYKEIQHFNRKKSLLYPDKIFSFVRWGEKQRLIVVASFETEKTAKFNLLVPGEIVKIWNLKDGNYSLTDHLNLKNKYSFQVKNGTGKIKLHLKPLESFIFEVKNQN